MIQKILDVDKQVGVYRSILIEKLWSLDDATGWASAVNIGAFGYPGENPRFAVRAA